MASGGAMTFRAWLIARAKDDTHIGDLSRDSMRSGWYGDSAASLMEHMSKRGACGEAFDALEDATSDYRAEL